MINETTAMLHLARATQELLAVPDEDATVRGIVTKAIECVPRCDCAAVTRRVRGELRPLAWSGDLARDSELMQVELAEGPTATVVWRAEICLVEDPIHDARWPRWAAGAEKLGVGSLLALRLVAGNERLGALSLYSATRQAFGDEEVSLALAFAAHAAVALFAAQQTTALNVAVENRHTIGIAQGILMTKHDLSADAAFALLRRQSNATNVKLRDVARSVVQNRGLPAPPGNPSPPRRTVTPLDLDLRRPG